MLDANTGKNTGKRNNLTIKHTRMPPICKKHTITPAMCKKHRRMPGKIRRAHLLFRVLYSGPLVSETPISP